MGRFQTLLKSLTMKSDNVCSILLSASDKELFTFQRFKTNTLRTLFISAFLTVEQLLYALFLSPISSMQQKIYVVSAGIMMLYAVTSIVHYKLKGIRTSKAAVFFSYSFAYTGLCIALYRTLLQNQEPFSLPTVYLAVNYAIAVIFSLTYLESSIMYALFAIASIFSMYHNNISPGLYVYIGDVLSNVLIAWIVSMLHYRNTYKNFINQILIRKANTTLLEKNDQIQSINEKLTVLSEHDPLTGIFNRRKIDQLLIEEWNRYNRYGCPFSIIILDVDLFKQVNDTFGHLTGDCILKKFTAVLESQLRYCDNIGRWGGEEFLILCKETNHEQAGQLARRLHDKLNATIFDDAGMVTASFGVACVYEACALESVITLADKRMYKAKTSGRNMVISSYSV